MKRCLALAAILAFAGCSRKEPTLVPLPPPTAKPPAPGLHLPVITIRTMDRKEVKVQLNGEDLGVTPCHWSITSSIAYADLSIPAGVLPNEARFVTSTQHAEDSRSKVDVSMIWRPEALAAYPKLRKGECVVIVEGAVGGSKVRGPLRLYVEGYRFTDYTPLVNPDGDDANRFLRTLWFERSDE